MIPLRIACADMVMTAPPGQEGQVRDLHVKFIDGASVSRWEPTPEELELLNAGGSVELWIMGRQPPVMLVARAHAEFTEPSTES